MTNKGDRDASIERLLPGAMQARAASEAARDCLDAETLAAWADEALSARERASVEAHAAGCDRCQAMLAAMVKTAPPPVVATSSSKARAWWWMAAFVPIAAALVVWFAVPRRAPLQPSPSADAAVGQAAPPAAGEPAAPRAAFRAQAPAEAQTEARNKALDKDAAPPRTLAKKLDAASAEQKTLATPAPLAPAAASANSMADARTSGAAAAEAGAAPASPPAASSLRREAAPARAFAFAPDAIIVSSNPSTRFRLLRGGGVQRSADGGATWRTESTPVIETLTTGASPSPSVCWLIGPSGIVLLTTDDRSWRRVPFPETVDLRTVTAADAEHATVTAVDGRAFVTADGGRSWSRSPDF